MWDIRIVKSFLGSDSEPMKLLNFREIDVNDCVIRILAVESRQDRWQLTSVMDIFSFLSWYHNSSVLDTFFGDNFIKKPVNSNPVQCGAALYGRPGFPWTAFTVLLPSNIPVCGVVFDWIFEIPFSFWKGFRVHSLLFFNLICTFLMHQKIVNCFWKLGVVEILRIFWFDGFLNAFVSRWKR